MGSLLFDQYSYVHLASGVIAYYWGFSFYVWMIFHFLFELFENSKIGMFLINSNIAARWPGGKPKADTWLNILGDNISAAIGWISAFLLNYYGDKLGWYKSHIK